jgi:hypothetical protein
MASPFGINTASTMPENKPVPFAIRRSGCSPTTRRSFRASSHGEGPLAARIGYILPRIVLRTSPYRKEADRG